MTDNLLIVSVEKINLLPFLQTNKFEDRFCSNRTYNSSSLKKLNGHETSELINL